MQSLHFLFDECLSPTLTGLAHRRGFPADHVVHLGLSGTEDHDLIPVIFDGPVDYVFVTNNRGDFLDIHGRRELHAGLIVIVPNVGKTRQAILFDRVLDHIAAQPGFDLTNAVLEIDETGRITTDALHAATSPVR